MKTVIIKDETPTGKRILAYLRRHPKIVTIIEGDLEIPEKYTSLQKRWEMADKQLLEEVYGKLFPIIQ